MSRLPRFALTLAGAALLLVPAAASAQGLKSDNVTVVGKLPDAVGAIGARFSPDGDTMYVTSATVLRIFNDVTAPESPQLLCRGCRCRTSRTRTWTSAATRS